MPHKNRLVARWAKTAQHLNNRTMLIGLLLLEAAIFLLDVDTGATISYSPYLSAPTALAAWFLGPYATVAFVVLSALARAYDYSLHQSPGEPLWMLSYAVLQSGVFYAIVAVLVRQVRQLVDHLSNHASHLQHVARNERHQRFMAASIRRALPEDVETIVHLTTIGGEDGNFDQAVQDRVRQAALIDNFKHGIANGFALRDVWGNGGNTTVPIDFWVSSINGRVAGYMMILGMDANKGSERELHAVAVDPAFRGLGVGAALVDFFCSHYGQRRLFSACKPGVKMEAMLTRRGFRPLETLNGDYQIYVLN
jgi:ribosomal protein S18 acetylase RimI-like enzyme